MEWAPQAHAVTNSAPCRLSTVKGCSATRHRGGRGDRPRARPPAPRQGTSRAASRIEGPWVGRQSRDPRTAPRSRGARPHSAQAGPASATPGVVPRLCSGRPRAGLRKAFLGLQQVFSVQSVRPNLGSEAPGADTAQVAGPPSTWSQSLATQKRNTSTF